MFRLVDRRKRQKKRKKKSLRPWKKTRMADEAMKLTYSTGRECWVLPTMTTLYGHFENKRKLQKHLVKENAFAKRSTMPNRK